MKNIHLKTNIKVKYIHVLHNFYDLEGPPLELEGLVPPLAEPEASIPPPCTHAE